MVSTGIQISINVMSPIVTNDRITAEGNAIILKNAGDEVVTLDNGFTLPVGAAVTFRTGQDENYIIWNIRVSFDGTGVNPRLEIATMVPNIEGYANYKYR